MCHPGTRVPHLLQLLQPLRHSVGVVALKVHLARLVHGLDDPAARGVPNTHACHADTRHTDMRHLAYERLLCVRPRCAVAVAEGLADCSPGSRAASTAYSCMNLDVKYSRQALSKESKSGPAEYGA